MNQLEVKKREKNATDKTSAVWFYTVRHAQKKRLREGERESKGKNNEKIESYIVR